MNQYGLYIQFYPTERFTTVEPPVPLEETYNCKYKQFKDFFFDGEVKNIYTEDYAEQNGVRIYIPEEPTHSSYECKLELLFSKATVQEDTRRFYNDIKGRKIEWHDTFRNRYVTLVSIKQPQIQQEILYGKTPYMLVTFTFNNIHGTTFLESQIHI